MRFSTAFLATVMAAGAAQAGTVQIISTGTLDQFVDPQGLLQISEPLPGAEFTLTIVHLCGPRSGPGQ